MTSFEFTDVAALKRALGDERLDSFASLETVLRRLNDQLREPLVTLQAALARVARECGVDVYARLLPAVRAWAEGESVTCQLLEQGVAATVALSETQVRDVDQP